MLCVDPWEDGWWRHSQRWGCTVLYGLKSESDSRSVESDSATSWTIKSRPEFLEWVAFPFSRGSSQFRDQTRCSAVRSESFNQLSYQGTLGVLEQVAYSFSSRSFWPRNWTGVSCITGGFFTNWTIREALIYGLNSLAELKLKAFCLFSQSGNPLLISFHWQKQVLM